MTSTYSVPEGHVKVMEVGEMSVSDPGLGDVQS